ncbi:MAG: beta-lactamase family protein [Gemmatimonadota bacterium]|nr:beta-lactamase family protein [Gemmatimonadota bacterium]
MSARDGLVVLACLAFANCSPAGQTDDARGEPGSGATVQASWHGDPSTARISEALPPPDQRLVEALRAFIPHVLRRHDTPGLNLAIARHGQVIYEEGFGLADVSTGERMSPATTTHSGSMGKTYTGTAVMQLVESGLVDLDRPVNEYLGGFRIENPFGGQVTTRHLLTHRSGLSGNGAFSMFETPPPLREHVPAAYARESFPPYAGVVPLWGGPPGETFRYSNLGLATLGYLVEVANPEGLSFSDYVQEHILDPLDMVDTQYPPVQDREHVRPDLFDRMSVGYARFGGLLIPTPTIYFADFPAGTVVTTPGSHIRLLLAYMGGGGLDGGRILDEETVQWMLTPQFDDGLPDSDQGLIWRLSNWGERSASFGHGGAHMWGWTNHFEAFPELDLAIAISMNRWDIPGDAGGARYAEARAIIEFVRSWVMDERVDDPRTPAARSWAWKYSYVAGLALTERILGALGVGSPITEEMVERMVDGTRVNATADASLLWDPDGFRTGVSDMSAVEPTIPAITAFYASADIKVGPEEMALIYADMGGEPPW